MVIVVLLLLDWMTVSSRGPCGTEIGLKLGHSQDKGYVFSNQSHSKIDFFSKFLVFSDPKLVKISWIYGLLKFKPIFFFFALF